MGKIFKSIADVVTIKSKGSDTLGEGSFAKVRMVCHRDSPTKTYAMKAIQVRTERERQQVLKEISLHQHLVHENIIRFEDFIDGKKEMHIFLELAKNGDLFSHINRNKCSEAELTRFFLQTCRAIQYMHKKNVMHRDLKPENILLDANFNIKVCDFGWSAEFSENVPRETLCGTFEYMAPEVLLRKRQSTKTDVWALGILLYELFHGHAPFRGRRLEEVLEQISRNTLAFKKTLNPLVKDLIVRILKFYPHERPNVDQILESEFIQEYMNGMVTKREQRSPSPTPVSPVYVQNGCFLKQKEPKTESFFEVGPTNTDLTDALKTQPFFNIYLERQPVEAPTVTTNRIMQASSQTHLKTPGSTSDLFRSFNQGPATPNKGQYASFTQPSLTNLSANKASMAELERDPRRPPVLSCNNTPQKVMHSSMSQQPQRPLGSASTQQGKVVQSTLTTPTKDSSRKSSKNAAHQDNRSPQPRPVESSSQRYLSSGPERVGQLNFKVISAKALDVPERTVDDGSKGSFLKKVQSQSNIQLKTLTRNPSELQKSFNNGPVLSTSFSQHCLNAPQKREQNPNAVYNLTEAGVPMPLQPTQPHLNHSSQSATFYNACTRLVTCPDMPPKSKPSFDQNRPHHQLSPAPSPKNGAPNSNIIYRKIVSTDKSFANYFTTFQKLN